MTQYNVLPLCSVSIVFWDSLTVTLTFEPQSFQQEVVDVVVIAAMTDDLILDPRA